MVYGDTSYPMIGNIVDDAIADALDDSPFSSELLCEVLVHERRRYALYCLVTYQTPLPLADVADEVARLEYDAQVLSAIPENDVRQIYLDLYHAHIPKLADRGLVSYNQERDIVELTCGLSEWSLPGLIDE